MNLMLRRRGLMNSKPSDKPNLAAVTNSFTLLNNPGSRKILNTDIRGTVKKGAEYNIEFDIHVHCDQSDTGTWAVDIWGYGMWNNYIVRMGGKAEESDRYEHVSTVKPAGRDTNSDYRGFFPIDTWNIKGFVEITNFVITEA